MTVPQAFQVALQHHLAGHLAQAEALYRQILSVEPQHARARHHLGLLALQSGNPRFALELIIQAVQIAPDVADFRCNLGKVYHDLGRLDEAAMEYRRAIALEPDLAAAHFNLGVTLYFARDVDGAIESYQQAIRLNPDYVDAYCNLGLCLGETGRLDEAAAACHRALALNSGHVDAQNTLGGIFRSMGAQSEAINAYRRTVDLDPRFKEAHSNLILTLHYSPDFTTPRLATELSRWEQKYARPLRRAIKPHGNERSPGRRLRVGYVSPDFCDHPVGRFTLPLLAEHDRQQFEVFCYAQISSLDEVSHRLRAHSDHWYEIAGMSDLEVAELVRQHRIDILVDLALHTAHHRLLVFAQMPAPVQVSFAGYPGSTGVETIAHRISDKRLEMGESSSADDLMIKVSGHERIYLIDSFWCYDPCGMEVAVNALPARDLGTITFGSLNNFCKVNEPVLKLWAQVLKGVSNSRLIVLSQGGRHRERTLQVFQAEGVASDRVSFVKPRPRKEYLELFHRLDIALDTFPYNGHATSLDALWMGVPVVSLCGEHPVSRAGFSQLSNLGLPELVASSENEYVEIAIRLANDLPRLRELRSTLRQRMEKSVLMDASHFARQIEHCYRTMWHQWCATRETSEIG